MIRIVFAAAVLAFAGCHSSKVIIGDPYFASVDSKANVYARHGQAGVLKIAVMPFKAATELIGSSVSDVVVTELLRTQKYSLVERGQMAKVLSETELAMAGLSETKAVEAARMLGAEAVVIGTVDEYGMQAKGGDTYAVVGLAIRLIDCSNGKIIWSADLAKMAKDDDTPLSTHARDVVHELVAGLYQNLVGQAGNLPPPAPSGVEVGEMGLREAVVRWAAPSYPAKYRIERAVDAEGPFTVVAEVSASAGRYVDRSGLADSSIYYYRLSGVGKSGIASDPSPAVETMTAPPPDSPGDVAAAAPSSRCIRLSWSPPSSEGIEKYRVERSVADGGDWKTVETSATTIFVDGGFAGCDIADSTRYRYRVFAMNRVGAESAASKEVEVVSLPPPAVITGFSCKANEVRCVPIHWNRSAEDDVAGYELERADSPSGPFAQIEKFKSAGTTQFLDGKRDPGNLEDGHAYSYRIRSFNKVGAYSAWTKPIVAKTRLPPPAPEGVEAGQRMPRSSKVTWKMSPDEKVVGYEVERKEEGTDSWKEIAELSGRGVTSLSDRAGASESAPTGKLRDGTAYLYRVRAFNTAGARSEWSKEVRAVTKPAPKTPSGVKTTVDEVGSVKVEWNANPESDIVEYVVEACSPGGWFWKTLSKGSKECSVVETGLGNGVERVYRVKAIDANTHESEWSAETPGSSRRIPDPPSALKAECAGGEVKVSFAPPRDGMKSFNVYRKKFVGLELIKSVEGPEATLAAPPAGEKFDIVVTAVDERGLESEPSEKATVGG